MNPPSFFFSISDALIHRAGFLDYTNLLVSLGTYIQYLPQHFNRREQLFACGYPLSAATDLGRLLRTGEPVRCQVRPVGARLQATLVKVGPESPSELQGWLQRKKVDEGDFAKCLDRRPWTAKLPMIKVGNQSFHFESPIQSL